MWLRNDLERQVRLWIIYHVSVGNTALVAALSSMAVVLLKPKNRLAYGYFIEH